MIDRNLAAGTDDSRLNMEAGVILVGLGRDADAAVRFKRVLLTDPDSPNALYNAGTILFQIGEPDEGRGLLRRFLQLHPDHPYATYARQQLEQ
ncbi:MAG: tetratricopeptide repeat protein [bacterium]|nr:tetratricopeptide repeat protein [bacterium]